MVSASVLMAMMVVAGIRYFNRNALTRFNTRQPKIAFFFKISSILSDLPSAFKGSTAQSLNEADFPLGRAVLASGYNLVCREVE